MKTFSTEFKAVLPNGNIERFSGPEVKAINRALALEWVSNNLPVYMYLSDEIIAQIPCDDNFKPDWRNMVDFENDNLN